MFGFESNNGFNFKVNRGSIYCLYHCDCPHFIVKRVYLWWIGLCRWQPETSDHWL